MIDLGRSRREGSALAQHGKIQAPARCHWHAGTYHFPVPPRRDYALLDFLFYDDVEIAILIGCAGLSGGGSVDCGCGWIGLDAAIGTAIGTLINSLVSTVISTLIDSVTSTLIGPLMSTLIGSVIGTVVDVAGWLLCTSSDGKQQCGDEQGGDGVM